MQWSFGRGENVAQCQRERYAETLDVQRNEGCRVEGGIRVNKVVGNFHLAPGKSFSNGNVHAHDLENYFRDGAIHNPSHIIHSLRFGPPLPDKALGRRGAVGAEWTNHHINPLDGTERHTDDSRHNYMYFVKVVSTVYLPLGWEKRTDIPIDPSDPAGLGMLGRSTTGSVETHQYSVTSHDRNVDGEDNDGHKERLHARGGIPGVFFSYVSGSTVRAVLD